MAFSDLYVSRVATMPTSARGRDSTAAVGAGLAVALETALAISDNMHILFFTTLRNPVVPLQTLCYRLFAISES
jgi:hypothetical protein